MAATAPTLALRNFDSLYSKVFGRGWPSARLALLSPKKYCLIVNSFYSDQPRISNKKITRIESDVELGDCQFKGRLINRNPRNLEQSSVEHKPTGFWLDESPPANWNVVSLEQSGDHLVGYLKSWSGKQLVSASSSEPQLTKYFRNADSRQAAILLGKVLSRRCIQSGYLCAGVKQSPDGQSPKTKAFLDSIVAEGLALEESDEIMPRSNTDV